MFYDSSCFSFQKESEEIQQVGILSKELSDLIRSNLDDSFSLGDCAIVVGGTNIRHIIAEHQKDWDSHSHHLLEIISAPDYIGLHPNKKSIEFIKQLDVNILVAVRIKNKDPLWLKSFYEITPTKLNGYIAKGRVIKMDYSSKEVPSTNE